jgi:hypothetical protein
MTNTKFNSYEPKARKRYRKGSFVLGILALLALLVTGYLAYRLLSVQEEEIVLEQVKIEVDRVADYDTPKPQQDEISNWTVPGDHPRFMSIEAIGLGKTRVETVGRNSQNAIDIPVNVWNAAWFNESAKPGASGAGMYDCHTFFGVGNGLCDNLKNIQQGNEVLIERGDGIKYYYSVVEVRELTVADANAYMGTLLSVPEGYNATQSISIITCSGNFNTTTQSSDKRIVVRAVLVR